MHPSGHSHEHHNGHDHDGAHDDDGVHDHPRGLVGAIRHLFSPHSHDHAAAIDSATANREGMRALIISLVGLGATAVVQVVVVAVSGSVALVADTVHNFSDALTALPLGVAFWLGRRPANRRYTYGYGRAETSLASSSSP